MDLSHKLQSWNPLLKTSSCSLVIFSSVYNSTIRLLTDHMMKRDQRSVGFNSSSKLSQRTADKHRSLHFSILSLLQPPPLSVIFSSGFSPSHFWLGPLNRRAWHCERRVDAKPRAPRVFICLSQLGSSGNEIGGEKEESEARAETGKKKE